MSALRVNDNLCDGCGVCVEVCPFDALTLEDEKPVFGEACRVCPVCREECPNDAIEIKEQQRNMDIEQYSGVMVVAELNAGRLESVTSELIGEAKRLAKKMDWPVYGTVIGEDCDSAARELITYGIDSVLVFDHPELRYFRPEPYTDALETATDSVKPAVMLMAGTPVGRTLAPRIATRLRTGLTADCTSLDITEDGRLLQTRPAFGGDVMATIETPYHRPQMATVRPKVMAPAEKGEIVGEIRHMEFSPSINESEVLHLKPAPEAETIADAEIVVAAGRGIKEEEDLEMLEELAQLLGGMVGCTRPLVEQGWMPATMQIGLSGRTVRPKLYIGCGVSGAIQHVAGMRSSDQIIAINHNENAPIFEVAHYAVIGDLYEVVPGLIDSIKKGESSLCPSNE